MNSPIPSSIDASHGAPLSPAAAASGYEPPVLRLLGNAHDLLAGPGSLVCDFGPTDPGAGTQPSTDLCE